MGASVLFLFSFPLDVEERRKTSFTPDGWGGGECGPIVLVTNVAPVDSAFAWHDWRPF